MSMKEIPKLIFSMLVQSEFDSSKGVENKQKKKTCKTKGKW